MLQQDQRGRGRRMEGLPTVLPVKARQMLLFKENGSGFSDPAFTENRQEPIHRWVPSPPATWLPSEPKETRPTTWCFERRRPSCSHSR